MARETNYGTGIEQNGSNIPTGDRILSALPNLLVGLGIVFRLRLFLSDRTFWFDEAALALNLLNFKFVDPFAPTPIFDQAAPPGFLMLSKAAVDLFGDTEQAYRLFPLICGIASLFMFKRLAELAISRPASILALALFAVSPSLTYYSAEFKQYSSDVAFLIAIVLLAVTFFKGKGRSFDIVVLAFVGMISIFISHVSIFSLAGVGLVMIFEAIRLRNHRYFAASSICAVFWLSGFAALYFATLRNIEGNQSLFRYWRGAIMPMPPKSFSDLGWIFERIYSLFSAPFDLHPRQITVLFCIVGIVSIFRFGERQIAALLLLPFLFAVLASALQRYPIEGRLMLFIVPSAFIFSAKGAAAVSRSLLRFRFGKLMASVVIALLLFGPVGRSFSYAINPRPRQNVRVVVEYFGSNRSPSDNIYFHCESSPSGLYYAQRAGYANAAFDLGCLPPDGEHSGESGMKQLFLNSRFWIGLSPFHPGPSQGDDALVRHLNTRGRIVDRFKDGGTSVILYELPVEK